MVPSEKQPTQVPAKLESWALLPGVATGVVVTGAGVVVVGVGAAAAAAGASSPPPPHETRSVATDRYEASKMNFFIRDLKKEEGALLDSHC